jgi:hypothetical protein
MSEWVPHNCNVISFVPRDVEQNQFPEPRDGLVSLDGPSIVVHRPILRFIEDETHDHVCFTHIKSGFSLNGAVKKYAVGPITSLSFALKLADLWQMKCPDAWNILDGLDPSGESFFDLFNEQKHEMALGFQSAYKELTAMRSQYERDEVRS